MTRLRKTSEQNDSQPKRLSSTFKVGLIALAFLVLGYQAALFVHSPGVASLLAHRDRPDTVFVIDGALAERLRVEAEIPDHTPALCRSESLSPAGGSEPEQGQSGTVILKESNHSPQATRVYSKHRSRKVENFPFDPNTVGAQELQRLGFSEKQALSIIAYRNKGGRFRRASDFAKSYVVADSVFKRLEPYIRIPKLDINAADSAAFDSLPGIGGYFAARMVEYRRQLGGYSFPEQLMEIYHFDVEKYEALSDLITVGPARAYPLWALEEDELCKHPYIRNRATARGIVLFRNNHLPSEMTVQALLEAGVIDNDSASKLSRCRIAEP